MANGTGDTKLLALIDSGASFNFMCSLLAKLFSWVIKPNNTLVAVKLANGTVVCSSGATNSLVSSGVWQAYATFSVLNVLFEVILSMPWLLHVYLQLD